jgi:uncharacterized protein (TIGR00725 family)
LGWWARSRLSAAGAVVVCGGLGGVMEAACRGARSAGGLTVGLLPGLDPRGANPWVEVIIPTGLGEARNLLLTRPDGLEDSGIVAVDDPADAVALALELAAAHEAGCV